MDTSDLYQSLKENKVNDVLSYFKDHPAHDPQHHEIHASALALIKDYQKAIIQQRHAYLKSKREWRYARNLATYHALVGEHLLALQHWIICFKKDSNPVSYLNNMILAAQNCKQTAKLIKTLEETEESLKANHDIKRSLLRLYLYDNRPDDAYRMYLQHDKEDLLFSSDDHFLLALLTRDYGHLSASLFHLDHVLAQTPDHIDAHFERAQIKLRNQQFSDGFEEFEWRLKKDNAPCWKVAPELKKGEAIKGKKLFIYGEQGAGDILHFSRYLDILTQNGASFLLKCHASLLPYFHAQNIPASAFDEVLIENFDLQCPLLSLPYRLEIDEKTFVSPSSTPTRKPVRKIGLCWSGSPNFTNNHLRSPALHYFKKLEAFSQFQWFSLLPRQTLHERPFHQLKETLNHDASYLDTVALMKEMDLIISVDTSSAHLAGQLNCPTWLLLHFPADWRWFHDADRSTLYPSFRIFKQKAAHTWDEVFERLFFSLNELIND